MLHKLLTGPPQKFKCFSKISHPRRLLMGAKFQNKNQNDNPRTVLLDSLIMPYAHILLCVYVLIKNIYPLTKHTCTYTLYV